MIQKETLTALGIPSAVYDFPSVPINFIEAENDEMQS